MNTLKLFFKSLINNEACIDGGRKKPWYFAVIMFFMSIAMALVPIMTNSLKQKVSNDFESTTYGAREAFTSFSEELNKPEYAESMYVIKGEGKKDRLLVAGAFEEYRHYNVTLGADDFVFRYDTTINSKTYADLKGKVDGTEDTRKSVIYFSKDTVCFYFIDPVNKEAMVDVVCKKAYKYFSVDYRFASNYKVSEENLTKTINDSWKSWVEDLDTLFKSTRLTKTWTTVGIDAALDGMIALIMVLMIWLLTRGKKNPYNKVINPWNTFKLTSWTMITPGILALALGFFIKGFASAIFPLLLGVRAMWLSMKSFRPDGSGYPITDR